MALHPAKDIIEYKRLKDSLKKRFQAERTGDQDILRDQTKLLKPIINVQQETAKAIQDTIVSGQDATSNALVPFTTELQRRNDQAELPFYQSEIPAIQSTLDTSPPQIVNLDEGFDDVDKQNLTDLSFELPNKVFENKNMEETLGKVDKKERSLRSLKATDKSKRGGLTDMYTSQHNTIMKYKNRLNFVIQGEQLLPKKSGKGLKSKKKVVDVIYYSSVDELCKKLTLLCASKKAGNNGVNNEINSILDELLRTEKISKDEYDNLYKNIF